MAITTHPRTMPDPAPAEPKTMRAAVVERFGGPEALTVISAPAPVPGPDEVLIAVNTAGVGSWDADMRAGWSPGGDRTFPLILGSDGSGHVAAVGSRVRRYQTGDAVYAYGFDNPKGGFYAQYVALNANNVALAPPSLTLREAGAIPATGLTALQGIDGALQLRRGESIVILGASGGVGTLAVQFAKLRGARVLAIASGDDGVALARQLGADTAIDGRHADVQATGKEFAPDGVECVLALTGGTSLERCIELIRRSGRLAYPNGVEPAPEKVHGIEVLTYDAEAGAREFEHLNRAVEQAKLRVPIAGEYPLEDVGKAHQRLAEGHVLGKLVLRIG